MTNITIENMQYTINLEKARQLGVLKEPFKINEERFRTVFIHQFIHTFHPAILKYSKAYRDAQAKHVASYSWNIPNAPTKMQTQASYKTYYNATKVLSDAHDRFAQYKYDIILNLMQGVAECFGKDALVNWSNDPEKHYLSIEIPGTDLKYTYTLPRIPTSSACVPI